MRFGLQKLTLLDYPGAVACTVFCCGCNLRCPFCHNASLVTGNENGLELDFASLLEFLEKRRNTLDGVCFTGGEILLHPDAVDAIAAAKALGYKVKVDTNGTFPKVLKELISSGNVDYVAMDIKGSPEKYALCCGREGMLEAVSQSVQILLSSPVDYEFRTTVTGNLHEISDFTAIGKWISGAKRYFLQAFADSGDILDKSRNFSVSGEFIAAALEEVRKFVPDAALRGR